MAILSENAGGDQAIRQPGATTKPDGGAVLQREAIALMQQRSAQAHGTHGSAGTGDTTAGVTKAQTCPAAKEYRAIIDNTARNIFDIKSLGDINHLRSKFDCTTDNDPIKVANKRLYALTGDAYNYAMSAAAFTDMEMETSGRLSGIGLVLTNFELGKNGKPIMPLHSDNPAPPEKAPPKGAPPIKHETGVFEPIAGSPGAAAGFQMGDLIVKVDKTDTSKMDVEHIAQLLRGDAGTKVQITVIRDGKPITQTIERQDIKLPTVDEPREMNGFTYIKINSFGEHTPQELQAAMKKFPATKGFIVDVRDNPGGLVDTVVQSAESFIRNGAIIKISERQDSDPATPIYDNTVVRVDAKHAYTETSSSDSPGVIREASGGRAPYLAADKPVVLLTNGNTASAGEIFTGALGDNGVVVIGSGGDPNAPGKKNVGTYGKGIGQLVQGGLPGGAGMKVTELHYTTPAGTWPGDAAKHRYGLRPDIVVSDRVGVTLGTRQDAQLQAALAEIQRELQGHSAKHIKQ